MKGYLAIFVIVCAAISAQTLEITKTEIEAAVRVLSATCVAQVGASSDDLETLIKHEPLKTKEGKCLAECLMRRSETLSPEGKIVKERVLQIASIFLKNDEAKIKVAEEIIDECSKITDSDRCELAAKIRECAHNAIKSRNINIQFA